MANTIKKHIKDPGSAITHFIGMLMAAFASVPLIIKAAHEPGRIYIISIIIYATSLILLYAASTTYRFNRWQLYAYLPPSPKRQTWNKPSRNRMELCDCRNYHQGFLGKLSKMGILRTVHRDGLDLCAGVHTTFKFYVLCSLWLAPCRWYHLYNRRCYLCIETVSF